MSRDVEEAESRADIRDLMVLANWLKDGKTESSRWVLCVLHVLNSFPLMANNARETRNQTFQNLLRVHWEVLFLNAMTSLLDVSPLDFLMHCQVPHLCTWRHGMDRAES